MKEFKINYTLNESEVSVVLNTTEDKTAADIESLLDYYEEIAWRNFEDENGWLEPTDVLDVLIEDNPGWSYTHMAFDVVKF